MTKTVRGLKVGYPLSNGWTVLLAEQNAEKHQGDAGIVGRVLAFSPVNTYHPFCVWRYVINEEQGGEVNCFHGDYCEDLPEAMKAYERKVY